MTKYQEIKQFNQETGICINCFHEMAEPGKLKCFECAEKDRLRVEKNRDRKREHETYKQRYESRKSQGLCTACGKKLAEHGLKCNKCYIKARKRKIKPGITRSERPAYGFCYTCGNLKLKDKKVCAECYQTRLDSIKKICYKPVTEFWKQENDILFMKR